MSCADNRSRSKKKTKRHVVQVKKKHTMKAMPSANDLPVNAMSGNSIEADNQFEENGNTDRSGI